ncbi:hypothetical protein BASA60_007776 [Batrachochytrium salamandrivorans]|nr:hypothetical protein BASA60_007776 [Batrachochytrium salamandrivorans]
MILICNLDRTIGAPVRDHLGISCAEDAKFTGFLNVSFNTLHLPSSVLQPRCMDASRHNRAHARASDWSAARVLNGATPSPITVVLRTAAATARLRLTTLYLLLRTRTSTSAASGFDL